jgi:sugar/nucleoside kinase (ribokinase family)
MAAKRYDLLVAGEINPDLILSGDVEPAFGQVEKLVESATLVIGSSSAIFACGAARLGLKVAFIGVCGQDLFGQFMLDQLDAAAVDVSHVIRRAEGQTGLSVILAKPGAGDRAILTHPGCIPDLRSEFVADELLQDCRHLHVASYFLQTALQPGLADLFLRAHARGLTTSLDPNWDPAGKWQGFGELLRSTDVFLPNEKEALAVSGAPTVEEALKALTRKCRLVGIKCGERGAFAGQGEATASARALPVRVVDTVGAGDTFDAGFLYGWLNGWTLDASLQLATACGSLSTRAAGGTAAQPTLAEAMAYVSNPG